MIRIYFEYIRNLMGQQYPTAIVILLFALMTLLILHNKRQLDVIYCMVAGLIVALALPVYYLYLFVLGVPRGTSAVAYQVLPGILLAAYGMTILGSDLAKQYGKTCWLGVAVIVVFMASQPWQFTTERLEIAKPSQDKIDAEVYDLANLMGEGIAYMPTDMATQLCEIQSETNICFGDGYDSPKTETMTDIVDAIEAYRMDYIVCPRDISNPEWYGMYNYVVIGETEHYIVYSK